MILFGDTLSVSGYRFVNCTVKFMTSYVLIMYIAESRPTKNVFCPGIE